jgi:tRNA-specific 2-thiouridylase
VRARVVVGPREALRIRTITLTDVNWLMPAPAAEFECAVKVRSTRPPVAARVTPCAAGGATVEILGSEDAVAPGQACVFYANDSTRVLGGGWIARAQPVRAVA